MPLRGLTAFNFHDHLLGASEKGAVRTPSSGIRWPVLVMGNLRVFPSTTKDMRPSYLTSEVVWNPRYNQGQVYRNERQSLY